MGILVTTVGLGHALAIWPSMPQLKHLVRAALVALGVVEELFLFLGSVGLATTCPVLDRVLADRGA